MLRMDNRNMNFMGSSVVEDVVVATFSAGYNGGKELYINMSVMDHALFAKNQVIVEADLNDFNTEVLETVQAAAETI
jgi:hypothetical protein